MKTHVTTECHSQPHLNFLNQIYKTEDMLTNGIKPQLSNALLIFTLSMRNLHKFAASKYANMTYNAMAYARNINTKNILQNLATNNMLHPLNPFNITNYNPIHLPNRILTLHLNSMLQESISQTFNLQLHDYHSDCPFKIEAT